MFDDLEWSLIQAILSTEDFFLPEHRIIFTAIKSVIAKDQHPDPITLTDHLQAESKFKTIGGSNYLSTLTKSLHQNSAASNLIAYARIVKDKSLDRQIDTIWTHRDLNDSDKLVNLREAKILLHSHQETLIDATELLKMDIPKKEPMLFPWLFTRDIWMIHAWRGVGKSQLALEIAFSIATGTPMFDGRWYAPKARRIAYFDGEMGAEEVQSRIKRMIETHGVTPQKGYLSIFTPYLFKTRINLTTPEGQAFATKFINDAGAEAAVMDNLSTLAGGIDENSAKEFQPVQDWLIECRADGITVGFVNHSNKTRAQRGTSKHEDVLNASINLRKPDKEKSLMFKGAQFEIHFEKTRGKTQQPFLVSLPEETVPEAGLITGVWVVVSLLIGAMQGQSMSQCHIVSGNHKGLPLHKLPTLALKI